MDVIVVGAGPAGNMAAHRLSKLGHRVVVLDWRETLGDKLCTGIISRECIERYPPDAGDIIRKACSAAVITPSGRRHTIAKDEPQAYIIDRVAYVTSLARRASEAGAFYRLKEKVVGIERFPDGVVVRTTDGKRQQLYQAKVIIIASGFHSPLLRMVGLAGRRQTDYMIGCQAMVEANRLTEVEVYLGDDIAPGSFGWLVPASDSEALVGLVSRQNLNGHLPQFIESLQQRGKVRSVTGQPRQWGIPIRPQSKTYGDRVVVVGDAAGLAKPTTGGGIYYGMLSGEIAANEVHRASVVGDFSAHQLKTYQAKWKTVFGRDIRIGYYARRLYETLGDAQIERLVDVLMLQGVCQEMVASKNFSFDWHGGMILKAIGHREFGKVFKSFGPAVTPFLARLSRLYRSPQQTDSPRDN